MLKKSIIFTLLAIVIYYIFLVAGLRKGVKVLQVEQTQERIILDSIPHFNIDSFSNISKDTLKFDDFNSESKILLLPRENSALYKWIIDTNETIVMPNKTSRNTGSIFGELIYYQEFIFIDRIENQKLVINFS